MPSIFENHIEARYTAVHITVRKAVPFSFLLSFSKNYCTVFKVVFHVRQCYHRDMSQLLRLRRSIVEQDSRCVYIYMSEMYVCQCHGQGYDILGHGECWGTTTICTFSDMCIYEVSISKAKAVYYTYSHNIFKVWHLIVHQISENHLIATIHSNFICARRLFRYRPVSRFTKLSENMSYLMTMTSRRTILRLSYVRHVNHIQCM